MQGERKVKNRKINGNESCVYQNKRPIIPIIILVNPKSLLKIQVRYSTRIEIIKKAIKLH